MTHTIYHAGYKIPRTYKRTKLTKGAMLIEMMKAGVEVGSILKNTPKSVEIHYNRFLAK